MDESFRKLVEQCKKNLLKAQQDRMNGMKDFENALSSEIVGDEADIAKTLSDQHTALTQRERMLNDLREINEALYRIESGTYGVCEETEEPIEPQRLLAVPWTRLSLTGAEIREARKKRFA